MILCGFDIETSGLAIGSSKILEVACVRYCTTIKKTLDAWSTWVWDSSYPPLSEEALQVNGLVRDELQRYGVHPSTAFPRVLQFFDKSDAIIGHNANNFDKPFIECELRNYGFSTLKTYQWLDSRTDFEYPKGTVSKRLSHLAVDHGIHNPFPHKALFDVITMLEIIKNYDVEKALERAKSPMIRVEAILPFELNQQARDARYRFDGKKKVWFKELREVDWDLETKSVPFKIERVKE